MIQASEYLLDYTNNTHIGLVGYSLGAGAVYYAASHGIPENGIVLIGGGIGSNYYTEETGGFIPSHPWNPLVIIGRYDVLFNEARIQESLQTTFPGNPPELNMLKGESTGASMTMLLMPYTSHLFEPVDPVVVVSTVDWFNTINHLETNIPQTYLTREAFILCAFIFFTAALVLTPTIEATIIPSTNFNWRTGTIYGIIGFLCFVPSILMGNIIPFPAQLFGSSIAWWLLVWGSIMYLLSKYWKKDVSRLSIDLVDIRNALTLFLVCYVFLFGLEYVFQFGYRLMVPIMRSLTQRRILTLFTYLPFMLVHFYSESLWLKDSLGNLKGFTVSKLGLFAGIILVQYGGFYLLDTVIIGGFFGFIVEFLVAIVPMILISVLITHWSYRAQRTELSIILNALIFSWIAAGLFPY